MRTKLWWSFGAQYAVDESAAQDVTETVGKTTTATGQPVACTPGTKPTTDMSGAWQPRLLIGGCMIEGDAFNTGWEEVHLPSACSTPTDLTMASKIGCMDKGALNYDPLARQPAKCLYSLLGCTDSNALNYNSEASTDDGSCIIGKCGCNMGASAGDAYAWKHGTLENYVARDQVLDTAKTPDGTAYETLFVGKPLPGMASETDVGKVSYSDYSVVLSSDATATVLGGRTCGNAMGSECSFVIEGCMDSSAINYNSAATKNSNTWCVPRTEGCMMPELSMSAESDGAVPPRVLNLTLQIDRFGGFALDYSVGATVHTNCIVQKKGCTDTTAANYQPWATEKYECFPQVIGCLHPHALNYNCAKFIGQYQPCSDSVTNHSNAFCNYYEITIAEPTKTVESAKISITVDADCTSITAAEKASLKTYLADKIGVEASTVTIGVVCGSATIEAEFGPLDAAAYQNFQLMEATALSSTGGAAALLEQAGLSGYTVLAVSVTKVENTAYPPPSSPPMSDAEIGMIVGIVLGSLVLILVLVGVFFLMRKKKKDASNVAPA